MAAVKELKAWEQRERDLRSSLRLAESYLKKDAETLEKTKAYRDSCERLLAEHLRNAPILTPKQAAKKAS
jgi:hypothetical protein